MLLGHRFRISIITIFIFLGNGISADSHNEADLVFIVDGSSHTEETLFRQELLLIPSIIDQLPFEQQMLRFAVITYSKYANLQIGFGSTTNKEALIDKLWSIRKTRNSRASLCFALKLARIHLFNKNVCCQPKFVVIFSNGKWNLPAATDREARLLRQINVKIFLMVFGHDIDRHASRRLTSPSNIIYRPHITLNYVNNKWINNFITSNIQKIINEANRVAQPFNHTTTILPTTKVKTTQSASIQFSCNLEGQLVFVLDSSESVGKNNFILQLDLVKDVIHKLTKDKTKLAVAISTHGKGSSIDMSFQTFQRSPDVNKTISRITYKTGNSGSGEALSLINQNIFLNRPSPNIKRIVVILSSSISEVGPDSVVVSNVMKLTNGIAFLVVRIGENTNKWSDSTIASNPEALIIVKGFSDLKSHANEIRRKLCKL